MATFFWQLHPLENRAARSPCRAILLAVVARSQPRPALECAVEGAGFGKAELGSDVGHTPVGVRQTIDRQVSAQCILDLTKQVGLLLILDSNCIQVYKE